MEICLFRKFDAGAGVTWRHKKADCTVRALATSTGMTYKQAYELLYRTQGELHHCHFMLFDYLRHDREGFGVKRYVSFPAKRGIPRTRLSDFKRLHPTGRWIVQVAHHASAVVNGVCIDTWYPHGKTVYGAWEMNGLDNCNR